MKRSFETIGDVACAIPCEVPCSMDQEDFPSVLCCVCAAPMPPNDSAMCTNCLRSDVDITAGLSRNLVMPHCRGCNRYNSPPWVKAELESRELLQVCLKKIKGLKKKVKLVDANFLYTEPHSKRLKVKLSVQKEIANGAIVQHDFVVEFVVQNHQCEDCKRNYTPHIWVAAVQVRQKVDHRRTLYFLEQLLLKNDVMQKILFVKPSPDGFDFFFASKSHANTFSHFVQNHFLCSHKDSRQLVTHDAKNNTYKYKYTALVDICPVCKDDLVYFPPKIRAMHGGIGSLVLCNKVSTALHILDPFTLQGCEVARVKYYEHPFYTVCTRRHLVEFVVINVEDERIQKQSKITAEKHLGIRKTYKLCHVELARLSDFGVNEERCITRSHLGSYHLHPGDHVLGYDLRTINASGIDDKVLEECAESSPVIIVKKKRTNNNGPREKSCASTNQGRESKEAPDDMELEEEISDDDDPEIPLAELFESLQISDMPSNYQEVDDIGGAAEGEDEEEEDAAPQKKRAKRRKK